MRRLGYFQKGKGAMGDGESPELARYVELLKTIADNHLVVTNSITGLSALVENHGGKLDAHADDDRDNFAEQKKASEDLQAALQAHIDKCPGERPKRNWRGISLAITAAGGVLTALFKWLGPDK